MNLNLMLWPTALVAAGLFCLGRLAEQRLATSGFRLVFALGAGVLALPGILFAAYYTKLLGERIWLYEFRALPGSELSAAGIGLLAGFIHGLRLKHSWLQGQLRRFTVPTLVALTILVPYLKPVIRPLNWNQLQNKWEDDVCIQSTPSSCGPASAATLCRLAGKAADEVDLARESYTYAGGTENWYLARSLRKRGMNVTFVKQDIESLTPPLASIAGVKLQQGTGHFIALIGMDGTNYIVGDPLIGREILSLQDLKSQYRFTGFFMLVR